MACKARPNTTPMTRPTSTFFARLHCLWRAWARSNSNTTNTTMFAMSGKFIPVLLIYYTVGFYRTCWRKVIRSVMSRLYPYGMGYDKSDYIVGLMFNLVINKTIELKL